MRKSDKYACREVYYTQKRKKRWCTYKRPQHWTVVSLIHPLTDYRSQPDMSSNDGQELPINFKLGVILSAMLYGCVVTLALNCIPVLFQTSHTLPRHMRNLLLVYVTFMVAVSTINMVTLIIAFAIGQNILTSNKDLDSESDLNNLVYPNGYAGEFCSIFASWGGDAFMVRLFK